MALTDDQVRRIARLARIAIRPQDAAPVLERLNRVLGLIDQLRAVNTAGVEPMAHALEVVQRLRPDEVTEKDQHERFQEAAPLKDKGLYLVPKVIE